jgi:hypothetical protein
VKPQLAYLLPDASLYLLFSKNLPQKKGARCFHHRATKTGRALAALFEKVRQSNERSALFTI